MIGPRRRVIGVLSAVDDVRLLHPELALPLNWSRLQRVFARERIVLKKLPIESSADVIGFDGTFVVTLNSAAAPRQHTRLAAHEYGHIRLHFGEKGEIARNLSPCRRGDPRELEAELFGTMLMLGPDATPEAPAIARLIAALEAGDRASRAPAQLPFALPEVASPVRPRRRPRQKRDIIRGSDYGRGGVSHEAIRIERDPYKPGFRFFTLDHGWCVVHDVTFVPGRNEKPARRLCPVGDRTTQVRYFVFGPEDRRFYVFKKPTESRIPSASLLDRQFAASTPTEPRSRPTAGSHSMERTKGG